MGNIHRRSTRRTGRGFPPRQVLFLVLAAVLVLAAIPTTTARASADGSTPAAATAAAKAHFKAGSTFYDLGRFDDAIREFEAAYEAKNDPAFLFNLAQANRLGGHPVEALHFYRTYLRYVPNPPNLADIEHEVRVLEDTEAAAATTTNPPPPATAPPISGGVLAPLAAPAPRDVSPEGPRSSGLAGGGSATRGASTAPPPLVPSSRQPAPSSASAAPSSGETSASISASSTAGSSPALSTRRRVGEILAFAGAGVLASGIVFGVMAGAESRKVEQATVFDPAVESSGKTFDTLKWVALVTGVVTGAAGAVLYLTTSGAGPEPRAQTRSLPSLAWTPLAGRDFAGLAWQARLP